MEGIGVSDMSYTIVIDSIYQYFNLQNQVSVLVSVDRMSRYYYWYLYCWGSSTDTIIGIGIAEVQSLILVSELVSVKKMVSPMTAVCDHQLDLNEHWDNFVQPLTTSK